MTNEERRALEDLREGLRRRHDRSLDSLDLVDDYDLLEALKVAGFELRK